MLLIACPWCGPRDETEFHYGGQAHVSYPEAPDALGDAGLGRVPVRPRQPEGLARRALVPLARLPPLVQRGARHRHQRDPSPSYRIGEPPPEARDERAAAPRRGRTDRSRRAGSASPSTAPAHEGCAGDTLASALLANGVDVVAPSIYPGRPRGIYAAGAEEPNALVQLGRRRLLGADAARHRIELYDGLSARPLAGRGRLVPASPTPPSTTGCTSTATCWSSAAGRRVWRPRSPPGGTGARVMLVDEQPELGGSLLGARERIDGGAGVGVGRRDDRSGSRAMPEVRVLARTTAVGYYDHNYVVARRAAHRPPRPAAPRRSRASASGTSARGHVVLATGAHERPIVFADNDRPGVMLAGAARTYLNRYARRPGRRAVVFTTNDSAYAAALDLADAGVEVAAVVDARPASGGAWRRARADSRDRGARRPRRRRPRRAGELEAVDVAALADDGGAGGRAADDRLRSARRVRAAGTRRVHLFSQSRGAAALRRAAGLLRARRAAPGAAVGRRLPRRVRRSRPASPTACSPAPTPPRAAGFDGGEPASRARRRRASRSSRRASSGRAPAIPRTAPGRPTSSTSSATPPSPTSAAPSAPGCARSSTSSATRRSAPGTTRARRRASTRSAILAELLGGPVGAISGRRPSGRRTRRCRSALLAGRDRGRLHDPVRVTADARLARRARRGVRGRRAMEAARGTTRSRRGHGGGRPARVRGGPRGRRDHGRLDARQDRRPGRGRREFLDRIYTNAMDTLAVGSCRYGLMCTRRRHGLRRRRRDPPGGRPLS